LILMYIIPKTLLANTNFSKVFFHSLVFSP
jgi:hypothetical protein